MPGLRRVNVRRRRLTVAITLGSSLVPHFSYVVCCITSYLILSTLWILRSNTDRRAQARLEEADPAFGRSCSTGPQRVSRTVPPFTRAAGDRKRNSVLAGALTMGRFSNGELVRVTGRSAEPSHQANEHGSPDIHVCLSAYPCDLTQKLERHVLAPPAKSRDGTAAFDRQRESPNRRDRLTQPADGLQSRAGSAWILAARTVRTELHFRACQPSIAAVVWRLR